MDFSADKDDSSRDVHLESKYSTLEDAVARALQRGDDLDEKTVKKLIRKIDLRIVPALGMLYAVSLIDRVNLSAVGLPLGPIE